MPDAARIAQATAVEIPVTVQGSTSLNGTEQRELFSETTTTILTFDGGAVLNLKTRLSAGQSVFLRNDRSGKEILCRVVEVPQDGEAGPTDLEFIVEDPSFWGAGAEEPATVTQKSDSHETIGALEESQQVASIPELEERHPTAPIPEPIMAAGAENPAPGLESTGSHDEASTLPASHALPEITELALDHGDAEDPQVAKDAERLAAMVAKESRGISRRATAPEAMQIKPVTTPAAASNEAVADLATTSDAKPFSILAFRIRGILRFTPKENPIAVGIAACVLMMILLGVAWNAGRRSSIRSAVQTSAFQGQSTQQAAPVSGQPAQATPSTATNPATTTADVGDSPKVNADKDSAPPVTPRLAASGSTPGADQLPTSHASHRNPNRLNAQGIIPPQIVSEPQPDFPTWAKDLDVDAIVTLDAVIDEKGNVAESTPLSGPRVLRNSAQRAVELWIFRPALSNGIPTPTRMVLTVQFQR